MGMRVKCRETERKKVKEITLAPFEENARLRPERMLLTQWIHVTGHAWFGEGLTLTLPTHWTLA